MFKKDDLSSGTFVYANSIEESIKKVGLSEDEVSSYCILYDISEGDLENETKSNNFTRND